MMIQRINSGYKKFDTLTNGGFRASSLIIVAGRPQISKTAFVLGIAKYVALKEKNSVAIFSFQASKEELVQKLISSNSCVSFEKIKNKTVDFSDWPKITKVAGELSQAPLYIDDTPNISISELNDKIYHLKKSHNIQLIILDSLEPTFANKERINSMQKDFSISRFFKDLACRLNIPLIVVAQLPLTVHCWRLSDLQNLGINELDADLILFLSRKDKDSFNEDNIKLELTKNRYGPLGSVELRLLKEYYRIEEVLG
jgi:replicative DNA helicase